MSEGGSLRLVVSQGYVDDTYRLWEALDGGAIPIVQWALFFTAPSGILPTARIRVQRFAAIGGFAGGLLYSILP